MPSWDQHFFNIVSPILHMRQGHQSLNQTPGQCWSLITERRELRCGFRSNGAIDKTAVEIGAMATRDIKLIGIITG